MSARLVFAAACALLAAPTAGPSAFPASQSQAPPAAATQAQQVQQSFRAATTTVEVDVIVRDKSGRFVTELVPGDFEVTEDGTPQRVHSIYLIEGRSVTQTAGAGAGGAAAGTATSRALTAAATQRVFVLFFDQEHLDAGGFKRLQEAAESFLTKEFQAGDIGGILIGGTMIGNRLTTEREVLVQALRSAKFSQGQAFRKADLQDWPRITEIEATRIALANDRDVLAQVVSRAEREAGGAGGGGRGAGSVDYEGQVRSKASQIVSELRPAAARTIKTLLGLLNGLGRLPGRKTVVFMTDGFWVEESWGELRNIVGLAARGNVRFYSIDAQGLRRGSNTTDLNQMTPMETAGEIPTGAYNTIEDGPNSIAWDTGGYYIRKTNDFKSAFTEIAGDTSTYYVLGYTPERTDYDGKFRQIKVAVKRDGVTVRARKGYLAVAPAGTPAATGAPVPAPAAAAAPTAPPGRPDAVPPAAAQPAAPGVVPPAVAAGEAAAAPPAGGVPAPAAAVPGEPIILRPDSGGRVRELASSSQGSGPWAKAASEGWSLYGKGDLEGAERLLAQAANQGAAPWVSYALGFAQIGVKKPADALQSWERVRTAVPEFAPVYLDLADVYVQLNDLDRATELLRAAEKRWPTDADVLNALGTIQVRRNALGDAVDTFERAAKSNPKDPLAFFNLGRTYELRYFAMRRFSRPSSRWVDNPELLNKAIENYEACTKLGGPYEADARAAIDRLRNIR
jgi:VWFA-related protein